MPTQTIALVPGVIIENAGDDIVAFVPGNTQAVKLSGDAAEAIRALQSGRTVEYTNFLEPLIDSGIVKSSGSLSRRGLVKVAAVTAGAGISVLAMPSVAAANSGGGSYEEILAGEYYEEESGEWGFEVEVPGDGAISGTPSNLTVTSVSGLNPEVLDSNQRFVAWSVQTDADLSGETPIRGTFTWDLTYTVDFSYQPPQILQAPPA